MTIQNRNTLLENLKKSNRGLIPAVHPPTDLLYKKDFDANSWWSGGIFDADEHRITYVFHVMTVNIPGQGIILSYRLTFSDATTGWYYDDGEKAFPLSAIKMSESEFRIELPNGYIGGDFDNMELHMTGKEASVNVSMKAMGFPLYNAGSGSFEWQGTVSHQYSIPQMATTGSLTLNGKTYEIDGNSWFDRQWQMNDPSQLMQLKWAWMCCELSNKDIVSIWTNICDDVENSWATIMHPDGTHTVTYVNPLSQGIKKYWRSNASGNCYPVEWAVEIPDIDAHFEVVTSPVNQEMFSEMQIPGSCYEGISTINGTYNGKSISGHTFVEITGKWEEYCSNSINVKE